MINNNETDTDTLRLIDHWLDKLEKTGNRKKERKLKLIELTTNWLKRKKVNPLVTHALDTPFHSAPSAIAKVSRLKPFLSSFLRLISSRC